MKPSFILPAVFAAAAVAQPHNLNRGRQAKNAAPVVEKRAVHTEWVIETAWVTQTEYVDGTTTITVDAQATPVSEDANVETGKDAQFFETPSQESTSKPTSVAQAAPEPPASTREPTSQAAAPTPASISPSSVSVSQEEPAAQREATSSSSGEYDTSMGGSGELTYYTLGLGACGWNDAGKDSSEYYVAISAQVMGALSNNNPLCGRTITVVANGKSIVATIRDKCGDCAPTHIDGTTKLFLDLFGDLGPGRMPVEWYLNAA
ncbi:hypothetical protein jhhlp_007668 [Lomentospora prolificans]|uniref:RlpA-like protein double-psi beta-barrel domain-containing protein n=1 Tax=Lomentospora prolificans TaxID=41688 RepID=A0A2N3N086_9PEZI|nr:hypothetical protein jhhlp_007668 [Lomentospora prolificans]